MAWKFAFAWQDVYQREPLLASMGQGWELNDGDSSDAAPGRPSVYYDHVASGAGGGVLNGGGGAGGSCVAIRNGHGVNGHLSSQRYVLIGLIKLN